MNMDEWRYLLSGPTGEIKIPPNPTNWITDNVWPDMFRQITGMSRLENFNGIDKHFVENSDLY